MSDTHSIAAIAAIEATEFVEDCDEVGAWRRVFTG
jgi:hypothetical protein